MFNPAHVVRLTADCPLIDPEVIDKTILYHLHGGYDYTWNPGYPDGLDVEVMTFDALHRTWKDATSQPDREHVCTYIKDHPDRYKIGRYERHTDISHIKISVDTPEDYQKVKALVEDSIKVVRDLC
jgi:spore coat polysaccharide biosynthesis protein SpsF